MIKKTISYEDFNGNQVSEDFYFHLSKAEIAELEMSEDGGLTTLIKEIVASNDNRRILEIFKKFILMSVGEKSEDGRRFIKTQKLRDEFEQSPAYSELFMELGTEKDAGANFMNGIVPADVARGLKEQEQDQDKPTGPPTFPPAG